ncbi:hypothetical protein KJ359_007171 [Pestalotiopsis sp. 9143b]|nr:hypothetical protein KJ359_007171 [Pestalotiopsis sp. 9143b]
MASKDHGRDRRKEDTISGPGGKSETFGWSSKKGAYKITASKEELRLPKSMGPRDREDLKNRQKAEASLERYRRREKCRDPDTIMLNNFNGSYDDDGHGDDGHDDERVPPAAEAPPPLRQEKRHRRQKEATEYDKAGLKERFGHNDDGYNYDRDPHANEAPPPSEKQRRRQEAAAERDKAALKERFDQDRINQNMFQSYGSGYNIPPQGGSYHPAYRPPPNAFPYQGGYLPQGQFSQFSDPNYMPHPSQFCQAQSVPWPRNAPAPDNNPPQQSGPLVKGYSRRRCKPVDDGFLSDPEDDRSFLNPTLM